MELCTLRMEAASSSEMVVNLYCTDRQHGSTSQKMTIFIITAARTSWCLILAIVVGVRLVC